LIDSFAQTETMVSDTATGGTSSSDMVDSGVDSQHKGIFKERNISIMEDDEALSFSDDRFRYVKNVSEEEDECDGRAGQKASSNDGGGGGGNKKEDKYDSEEVSDASESFQSCDHSSLWVEVKKA